MTVTRPEGAIIDVAVFVTLLGLVSAAMAIKLVQFYGFHIHDWDTGIYTNMVWNLFSGDGFYSDQHQRNQLGEHFSPIMVVFVPLFHIAVSPAWLLVAQGLAVGTTYVLVYFIALKIFNDANIGFSKPLALGLAVWAFFYAPLTAALLFEFHPSTLATPFVAAAILALLYRQDWLLWLCVAVLLLSRENAPLAVMGLGLYAALVMSRVWLGVSLLGLAVFSAAIIMKILMPFFRTGVWEHYDRLGPLSYWPEKAIYLYTLLKGLAFLPLGAWRSLICAVPLLALNLAVAYRPQFSIKFHYDDFASVFLLVAAMHGIVMVSALIESSLKGRHATFARGLAVITALLLMAPEARNLVAEIGNSWPGSAERQLHRELAPYRELSSNVGIAADQSLGPFVSARPRYVALGGLWTPQEARYALARLKSGDLVLFTPIRSNKYVKQRVLESIPTLKRVHTSPVLYVYKVQDPSG